MNEKNIELKLSAAKANSIATIAIPRVLLRIFACSRSFSSLKEMQVL